MAEITENPTQELPGLETADAGEDTKKRNVKFRQQIELCKHYRRKLVRDWQINVDYRRGKPFASQSDEDRIAVPLDWALTKDKQTGLFSQVPAVRINHPPQTIDQSVSPWLFRFEQRINDNLVSAGAESVMGEVIPDCINAAGIGVAIVAREALTELVDVPAIDIQSLPPFMQQSIMETGVLPDGSPVPMKQVPREIDSRYAITRISPADFLWPIGFGGSNFDKAPWIGRSGRISWAVAVQRFNLQESDKNRVVGEDRSTMDRIDRLDYETERDAYEHEDAVSFDELFYYDFEYSAGARKFQRINHLVFVHGLNEPVVDEPWKGQEEDPQTGELIGALKYPIRVLTLAYVTDDPIPPSDSSIGRPSVDEINKSRSQMIQQRQHSIPIRTFDVNRVDPTIQFTLMRGDWQGMIPVQGNGQNIITEVSRSSFPQENFVFDKVAKGDLFRSWGDQADPEADPDNPEQFGAPGASTRKAWERAQVANFYVGIAQVLGGFVSLFEDPSTFGEGYSPAVSRSLVYSVLADSTIITDANQRRRTLQEFINFTAKSGWVNIESLMREYATLCGLDPSVVVQPPQPRPPVEPNISLRLTGTEDLLTPMTLAFLMKSGQAPSPELIEQAKQLIAVAVAPPPGMDPTGGQMPPGAAPPPPMPGEPPMPPPPGVGDANPNWSAMGRVNSRVLQRDAEE